MSQYNKEIAELSARLAITEAQLAEARKALEHIAGLPARADGSSGMVDNPHVKALRAAETIARRALVGSAPNSRGEPT